MDSYSRFRKQLLVNYLIGSSLAVGFVGGVFIFFTLSLTKYEILCMVLIMAASFGVMITFESLKFNKDLKPINEFFKSENPDPFHLQNSFVYLHEFPILTFKRIMGPHLLGMSIPAIFLTFLSIKFHLLLNIPFYYILLGLVGATLVAGMHGIIEFFLTIKAIQPLLKKIEKVSISLYGKKPSLEGKVVLSIRRKFQFSFIYITVFPILLFGLAAQVKLNKNFDTNQSFWSWAVVIIAVSLLFAYYGAKLLFLDVQQPIVQLQESMKKVKDGFIVKTDELYSDEFAGLMNGFNHMAEAIKIRDEKNSSMFESFLESMSAALDARDPYTSGHSARVAAYSLEIGMRAGMNEGDLSLLRKSALLHDIGKIGIPDGVLLKDGRLTEEEYISIQKHPEVGANIIKQVQGFSELPQLIEGILYHHERYDGKGYPSGLSGNNIPLFGRIIAVADAYDAMTSNRPYRNGMPNEKALSIILEGMGTQWDPDFAQLFVELKLEQLRGPATPSVYL